MGQRGEGVEGSTTNGVVRLKPELTYRQAEVLAYIKTYIRKFRYPPSVRCIADRFDIAVNAVAGHLKVLQAKGYIKRTKGVARGMVVVE